MSKKLGFKCTHCGNVIFVSTEYFAEEISCPNCHNTVEIPFMMYTWIPPIAHSLIRVAFPVFGAFVFLRYATVLGSQHTSWKWGLVWAVVIFLFDNVVWIVSRSILEVVYSRYVGKLPADAQRRFAASGRRVRLTAAGGDDLLLVVPKLVYAVLFYVYWSSFHLSGADPIAMIRGPWVFLLLGAAPAVVLSVLLAWTAFRVSMRKLR
jgi:hypothetical protein